MTKWNAVGAILLGLALLGCANTSREKEAVGTWVAPGGPGKDLVMKINEDKTWSYTLPLPSGDLPCQGDWTIDGDVVVFKTTKISKTPADEIRSKLKDMPEEGRDQIEAFLKDEAFKLTPDGKNLVQADFAPGQTPRVFARR